ncbi:hypothetical protein [Polymorphobacter megasporae]|uniref:hypothetical protein n=1 Tax=Glacieibacterium megasporae TaxID=2835787 RepID=UPI001C1DF3FB|nr:hypothetical protein [Polymorphobacter megasporae]UAJ10648.1 hypothetical protein KTC28_02515 [Polymorphobacter megasporae]
MMDRSPENAGRAALVDAVNGELALAGVDDVRVRTSDFGFYRWIDGGLECEATLTMPQGHRRRFVFLARLHIAKTDASILDVAEMFAKVVADCRRAGDEVARRIENVRIACEDTLALRSASSRALELIDVTAQDQLVTMPEDPCFVTIETTGYDVDLDVCRHYLKIRNQADTVDTLREHMAHQWVLRSRADALRAANAAGAVESFTLRLLARGRRSLGSVLEEMGRAQAIDLGASRTGAIPGMIIRRSEGLVTCNCRLDDKATWDAGTLTVSGSRIPDTVIVVARGMAIGRVVGFDLFTDDMKIFGVHPGHYGTVFDVGSPLVFFDVSGSVIGPALHEAPAD